MQKELKRLIFQAVGPTNYLTLSAVWNISRNYEPSFREFLTRIPESGTLLDVGANIGITCAIAKRMRPDLGILAFEPVPQNLKVLRRIRKLYSIRRMQIFPCAIGDRQGSASMTIPITAGVVDPGRSHLLWEQYRNEEVEHLPEWQTIEVPIRPLDSFVYGPIDAIKIDVEGHEFQVLTGAKALLTGSRPLVFCEIWESSNRERTLDFMSSLGFSITRMGQDDFAFAPLQLNHAINDQKPNSSAA